MPFMVFHVWSDVFFLSKRVYSGTAGHLRTGNIKLSRVGLDT